MIVLVMMLILMQTHREMKMISVMDVIIHLTFNDLYVAILMIIHFGLLLFKYDFLFLRSVQLTFKMFGLAITIIGR